MAALFRGSRNVLLRWNKHVDLAFGNVFVHVVGLLVSFLSASECVFGGESKSGTVSACSLLASLLAL